MHRAVRSLHRGDRSSHGAHQSASRRNQWVQRARRSVDRAHRSKHWTITIDASSESLGTPSDSQIEFRGSLCVPSESIGTPSELLGACRAQVIEICGARGRARRSFRVPSVSPGTPSVSPGTPSVSLGTPKASLSPTRPRQLTSSRPTPPRSPAPDASARASAASGQAQRREPERVFS